MINNTVLKCIIFCFGVVFVCMFLFISISRINFPYNLEWIEGGILHNTSRIINNKQIYAEPTTEFISFTKTPLYYYISAFATKFFGVELFSLRLISILSTLGIGWGIFKIVFNFTQNRFWGFVSAVMFFSLFKQTAFWYDLARVDMLFNLFLVISIYFLITGRSLIYICTSACFLALSFFTKQLSLILVIPFTIFVFFTNSKKHYSLIYFANTLLMLVLGIQILNANSSNWFNYYTFKISGAHELYTNMIWEFWWADLIKATPVLFAMYISYFLEKLWILYKLRVVNLHINDFLLILIVGSLIALGWLGRLNLGGYNNVLIPTYIGLCISLGILLKHYGEKKHKGRDISYFLNILILFQFILLLYNPFSVIPTIKDREMGNILINYLNTQQGEIWMPYHPELLIKTGKNPTTHMSSLMEILGSYGGLPDNYAKAVTKEYKKKIKNKEFSLIVLDQRTELLNQFEIEKYYDPINPPYDVDNKDFFPQTGMQVKPTYFFAPKP